ncbi:hypothetical protein GCM10010505_46810 [Kitasatospora aburaviensis]
MVARNGRQWQPLPGATEEVTVLAQLLQSWLAAAGLGIRDLRERLTPDHFATARVPSPSTLATRLKGRDLDWRFVEAVADVCFPEYADQQRRLDEARPLWDLAAADIARASLPAARQSADETVLRQVMDLQDQLARARTARDESEQARRQCEVLVILLLQMINQLRVKYVELNRRADALDGRPSLEHERAQVQVALGSTEAELRRAQVARTRAEAGQEAALEVADRAQRRADALQEELDRLQETGVPVDDVPDELSVGREAAADKLFLDDIAGALDRAESLNDESEALTRRAREELGHGGGTSAAEDGGPAAASSSGAWDQLSNGDHWGSVQQQNGPFLLSGAFDPQRSALGRLLGSGAVAEGRTVGFAEVEEVKRAGRDLRRLDALHGADDLFELGGQALRSTYLLLNEGRLEVAAERSLRSAVAELGITVGWLAHDSGRLADARSLYSEALAAARMADDPALEVVVFCYRAHLACDSGLPREAVEAAQAGQAIAQNLGSPRTWSVLTMWEAHGWALRLDRSRCAQALDQARRLFAEGPRVVDSEWVSFFDEVELTSSESRCWAALYRWERAIGPARQAARVRPQNRVRDHVLRTVELAYVLYRTGDVSEAALMAEAAVDDLVHNSVRSGRIRSKLAHVAELLGPFRTMPTVQSFFKRYEAEA